MYSIKRNGEVVFETESYSVFSSFLTVFLVKEYGGEILKTKTKGKGTILITSSGDIIEISRSYSPKHNAILCPVCNRELLPRTTCPCGFVEYRNTGHIVLSVKDYLDIEISDYEMFKAFLRIPIGEQLYLYFFSEIPDDVVSRKVQKRLPSVMLSYDERLAICKLLYETNDIYALKKAFYAFKTFHKNSVSAGINN